MSVRRRAAAPGGRAALTLALAALAAASLAAAPAGAAASRTVTDPAGDAAGPLDLVAARLDQDGPDLRLTLRTRGPWTPRQLALAGPRSLCVELLSGSRGGARSTLCAVGRPRGARAALRFTRLDGLGRTVTTRTLTDVHRPDRRTLEARFTPAAVGLAVGRFRWRVASTWTGAPGCEATPCRDTLPDAGTVAAEVLPPVPRGCVARGPSFRARGPGRRKLVALTFDDGPSAYTPDVLRILRRFGVHATFFLIGEQVRPNGDLVRRELAEGNAVGDHTYTHANVSGGGGFAYSQIARTRDAIRRVSGGYTPCLFRAPGGAVSGALVGVARSLGMLTIQWDVDPRDWSRPGSGAIYSTVVGTATRESIILLHDGGGRRDETVAALPRIIRTLRSRGYGFVTVPELLGLRPVYS